MFAFSRKFIQHAQNSIQVVQHYYKYLNQTSSENGFYESSNSLPYHLDVKYFQLHQRVSKFVDQISISVDSSSIKPNLTELENEPFLLRDSASDLTLGDGTDCVSRHLPKRMKILRVILIVLQILSMLI